MVGRYVLLMGSALTVGPHSAGADPGPACYGNGGSLTITDVNLLLGRLDKSQFSIPIDDRAAENELAKIYSKVEQIKKEKSKP